MTDPASQTVALLEECRTLEDGSLSRFATAESAVRYADISGDRRLQIEARNELVAAATFTGRMERSMAAFAWNLAHFEEEDWASDEVWLGFHWVTEDAPLVSTISRADIEQLLDQMEDVFQRNNWWMYPLHIARFRAGIVFGEEPESLRDHLRAFEASLERRGYCSAHYTHVRAVALARLGEIDRALNLVLPDLDAGALDEPPEYPHRSHSFVVLPLAQAGRFEEARAHFSAARRLCSTNRVFLRESARMLAFAALDERREAIAELVEHHLRWTLESYDHWSAMLWFAAAARAMQLLFSERVQPRGMTDHPRFGGGDWIGARKLHSELWSEAIRLSRACDERNGNDRWGRLIGQIRDGESPTRLFHG